MLIVVLLALKMWKHKMWTLWGLAVVSLYTGYKECFPSICHFLWKIMWQVFLENLWNRAQRFPFFKNCRPLMQRPARWTRRYVIAGGHARDFICQIIIKVKISSCTFFEMVIDILRLQWRKWKTQLAARRVKGLAFWTTVSFPFIGKKLLKLTHLWGCQLCGGQLPSLLDFMP